MRVRRWSLGDQIGVPFGIKCLRKCHFCLVVRRTQRKRVVEDQLIEDHNLIRRQLPCDLEQTLDGADGVRVIADKGGDLVAVQRGRISHQNASGSTRASSRAIASCASLVPRNFCKRQLRMEPC